MPDTGSSVNIFTSSESTHQDVYQINDDVLKEIFHLIFQVTGQDFSDYKKNSICRRIERQIVLRQLNDINDYLALLKKDADEVKQLFQTLLIGVTDFFRDPAIFEILATKVFPEIIAKKAGGEVIRIWVPGCSSGEEAYSIAMILQKTMFKFKTYYKTQIFATDIDAKAIQLARSGCYTANKVSKLSEEQRQRFFNKNKDGYTIKREVRDMLVFAFQNIITDPPFTKLDLICCRNLLIYLRPELQKKILPLFHFSLNPEGILVLGSSESIGFAIDMFDSVDKKWRFYRKKSPGRYNTGKYNNRHVNFPTSFKPRLNIGEQPIVSTTTKQPKNLSKLVEQNLLEYHAPSCVVINSTGEIIYIHGNAGKYLEIHAGAANLNILNMVQPNIVKKLQQAIEAVVKYKKTFTYNNLSVGLAKNCSINLRVKPIFSSESCGLIMVIFEEILRDAKKKPKHSGSCQYPCCRITGRATTD